MVLRSLWSRCFMWLGNLTKCNRTVTELEVTPHTPMLPNDIAECNLQFSTSSHFPVSARSEERGDMESMKRDLAGHAGPVNY